MVRVVLDANVVVSGLIRPAGPPGQILLSVFQGATCEAVCSPAILDEYRRSLHYPKVRRSIDATDEDIEQLVIAFGLVSVIVPDRQTGHTVSADPDDSKYIAAAIEGQAKFLVSGDNHLLDIEEVEGVSIVTPRVFMQYLISQTS